jgi:hypothetical protein
VQHVITKAQQLEMINQPQPYYGGVRAYTKYRAANLFLHHAEPGKSWEQKFDEKVRGESSISLAPNTKYTMALQAYAT